MNVKTDIEFIKQSLTDAGCKQEIIEEFICTLEKGEKKASFKLLARQRCHLLDVIHDDQKMIDCFDYFIRKMEKEGLINNGK